MLEIVLVLNALWFGAGYHVFHLRGEIFAKKVVDREHRGTPVFLTLIQSGKFVAGFNLAFCVMNVLLLWKIEAFDRAIHWVIILIPIAVAHATQFAFNVPVFIENKQGKGVWQVKGLMLFIFVIDFALMVLNSALVVGYLLFAG